MIAIGAVLRLWGLGAESLWQDEAWSWGLIQGSPKDLVLRLARFDAHPPVYFLCLQAWALFGSSESITPARPGRTRSSSSNASSRSTC
jgi:hypothetical protein